ncbi:MAG: hypothetical protein ACUVV0_12285 [Anaerolineae bacterium]
MKTLDRLLAEFQSYIKELCPEARIETSTDVYETEDADIFVYPPLNWDEDRCLELELKLAEKSVEALDDWGYNILVYVYEPEQQLAEAAQKQREAAKILQVAASAS